MNTTRRIFFAATFTILATGSVLADEDITDRMQEMQKFSDQQKAAQDGAQYQQYLKSNDAANGVSQRTGPTGGLVKGGGTVGYQWSTH